jgi:glycosyltransferase involved in cell wall biosynthesis
MSTSRKPLRILHIEYGIGFGGSVVSLSELIRGLTDAQRTESTVVTFQSPEVLGKLFPADAIVPLKPLLSYRTRDLVREFFSRTALRRVFRIPALKAYAVLDVAHDAFLARKLATIGRRIGADLVHVNNTWTTSGVQAARLLGVPCVVHFRGFEPAQPDTISQRYGQWVEHTVTRCIGISQAISESIVAFGVPRERVTTIHNPVSLEPYQTTAAVRESIRSRHGLHPEHLVVAVFGRLTAWKGQLELLQALAPILGDCPELRIMIVGDESDSDAREYGQGIRAFADAPEHRDRVVLTGYQHDVAGYYGASDIVVHCSREPEPFGRVVIEGMASGKPVVAMNEGGPPEIIAHDVDGLLVAPRDDAAMRVAIVRLRNDPALRARLGEAGRTTVATRFTPRAAAVHFLSALGLSE